MRKRLTPWLICSLVFSIIAFIAGTIAIDDDSPAGNPAAAYVSLAFSIVWLLVLIIALFVHGRRGLWLLVGLPTAIFMPVEFLYILGMIFGLFPRP